MSYLALYRKYRPSNFENLIGQEHIVKTLVNQIKNDRLGHAYLFTGTRGTGKTSAAKIFAKAINCQNPINGSPCGKCSSCLAIADPSNIDVIEIDAASNNGVNEIRDLREKVQYPPVSCKYKVYIVDEVHMLSVPAFNALLKTLEEPPKHAIFILATTEVHKIPATLLSRCIRFDFRLIAIEKIAELLEKIFIEEKKEYENEALFAIAKAGEGSIRDALSIAELALSYSEGKLTYNQVNDILGTTNFDILAELIRAVVLSESGKVLQIINDFASQGKIMGALLKDVIGFLRDLMVAKTCLDAKKILSIPIDDFNKLVEIGNLCNSDRILRILDIYSSAENTIRYSNHPSIVLECVSLKACKPEDDYNIDALISRIKALEEGKNTLVVQPTIEKKEEPKVSIEEITCKEVNKQQETRKRISDETIALLRGKLLFNMREKVGSEMLWNVLQNVELKVNGNVLILEVKEKTDLNLLESDNAKKRIYSALNEYDFDLQVILSEEEIKLSKIDEATEEVKKIFGSDIVIIK